MTKSTDLPSFNPHGKYGFATIVLNGRIKHVATYDADDLSSDAALVSTPTVKTTSGKRIYRHGPSGDYFAMAREDEPTDTPYGRPIVGIENRSN